MRRTNTKTIEVLLRIPEDWVNPDDPFFGLATFARDKFERVLFDAAVEQALPKLKLPKITITKEEVKERMIEILAERSLEELSQ
jgi:hypothetical protein